MKKITLALLFLLTLNGYSQISYFNYLDYTSEWRYYGGGWNGINAYDSYETRYFDGDETINGVVYYKMYSSSVVTQYNPPFGSTYSTIYAGGPYYMREDSTGKFYQLSTDGISEDITFDSGPIVAAQLGDPFPYAGATCNVETIESVYLGTTPLKKVKGVNTGNNTGSVEGVGFVGLACATSIEGGGGLNCYTRQGASIQFGTKSCDLFPVPVRTNLATSQNNVQKNKVVVSPNPSDGMVSVHFVGELGNTDFKVFNSYGQLVMKGQIVANLQSIDFSAYADGVYLLKVEGQDSQTSTKIIKQ
jgi:hypothetical protein